MSVQHVHATKREIPPAVLSALAARKPGIESGELLSALTRQWGGADRLAISIHDEFKNAQTGGMTRQRILEMITRLIVTTTEREHVKSVRPADMSTEDLESYAVTYLNRVTPESFTEKKSDVQPS